MDRRIRGWKCGWVDGWMGGWLNGWIDWCKYNIVFPFREENGLWTQLSPFVGGEENTGSNCAFLHQCPSLTCTLFYRPTQGLATFFRGWTTAWLFQLLSVKNNQPHRGMEEVVRPSSFAQFSTPACTSKCPDIGSPPQWGSSTTFISQPLQILITDNCREYDK